MVICLAEHNLMKCVSINLFFFATRNLLDNLIDCRLGLFWLVLCVTF